MKIERIESTIRGILGENRKKRTIAIIDTDGRYTSWRTFNWSDDVWEAHKEMLKSRRDVDMEEDYSGDIIIVFKKKGGKGSGE